MIIVINNLLLTLSSYSLFYWEKITDDILTDCLFYLQIIPNPVILNLTSFNFSNDVLIVIFRSKMNHTLCWNSKLK